MFGVVLSALNAFGGFLLRSVLAKFFVFFALFFLVTEFVSYLLASFLPAVASSGDGGLGAAFAALGPGVWYFLDLFQVPYGVSVLLAAAVAKFIIRRLPVIG